MTRKRQCADERRIERLKTLGRLADEGRCCTNRD